MAFEERRFAERVRELPDLGVGLGFRGPLAPLFGRDSEGLIEHAELVAEHWFSGRLGRPRLLGDRPALIHSLDLSLGTPGPLDHEYVKTLIDVKHRMGGVLLSDHLAMTRAGGVELGHLNPVAPTAQNAREIAEKIRELVEITDSVFLLENITTHLGLRGDLGAADFYQRVCDDADCGMLLDVTNILVNCHNLGHDPARFLDELDLARVVQLHVVGYTRRGDTLYDSHVEDITEDVYELVAEVCSRAPVRAILVERDGHWPHPDVLFGELRRLRDIHRGARAAAA